MLDQKRRVVLPKDVTEELGLVEGSEVVFQRRKGSIVLKKKEKGEDTLREIMSWNPKRRTRKLLPVRESEIKEIWH